MEFTMPTNLTYESEGAEQNRLARREQRWRILLGLSAALGVAAGLLGLVFSATNFLGLPDQLGHFGHLGTWLLVAFFPLMMLAAHALDKASEAKKALRLLRCRNHGLKLGDR